MAQVTGLTDNLPPPASDIPLRTAIRWQDVAPFAVAAVMIGIVSRHTLTSWRYAFTEPESYYSHAPLIPFMVTAILWHHRARIAAISKRPYYFALALLVPSLLVQIYASRLDMEALMSYSLIGIVWSAIWLVLGTQFVKAEAFALAFLVLMIPLPGPLLNDSTRFLQQLSTTGAAKVLNHIGFENTQTGYQITLTDFTLFVDVPCSGFKTLLALVTFDAFFASLLDGTVLKRTALFITTLPLALVINVTRIALIGVVGESISAHAAQIFHDYSGIITLMLGFLVLFGIARLFGCRKFAGLVLFS